LPVFLRAKEMPDLLGARNFGEKSETRFDTFWIEICYRP